MGKLTDENGVKWDIRTTSVQAGGAPATHTWFAGIDDSSERDYSGNQFALNDEETFDGAGGTTTKITWPSNGNPILRGPGNDDAALTSVRAFAKRQKQAGLKTIALRVTGTPSSAGSVLPLLLLVAVVVLADGKR